MAWRPEISMMMRWLAGYVAMALGGVAALLLVVWLAGGFEGLGLGVGGLIAFIAGITLTVVLSVGLMGLVFYSGRSGQDHTVNQDPTEPHPDWHRRHEQRRRDPP